jgi:hypothetical protein
MVYLSLDTFTFFPLRFRSSAISSLWLMMAALGIFSSFTFGFGGGANLSDEDGAD